MADDDFVPDADFVPDGAPARKSKYPDPKSFSAPDAPETGMIKTRRVPGTTLNFVEKPEALTPDEKAKQAAETNADIDKTVGGLATGGGAAGGVRQALGSALAKPAGAGATAIGINALAKGGSKPIAERIADALGKTVEHSILARGIQLVAPTAIDVGKKAAVGAMGAGRSAAPALGGVAAGEAAASATPATPLMDEPVPFKGTLSNAVDRLRAQAGNNPRAADLLARMEASKNTPSGTVTQSTGAH